VGEIRPVVDTGLIISLLRSTIRIPSIFLVQYVIDQIIHGLQCNLTVSSQTEWLNWLTLLNKMSYVFANISKISIRKV
jgi:hypothetical protein